MFFAVGVIGGVYLNKSINEMHARVLKKDHELKALLTKLRVLRTDIATMSNGFMPIDVREEKIKVEVEKK